MNKVELEIAVKDGLTIRGLAQKFGCSYTTIRYWLHKYKLKTKAADNRGRPAVVLQVICTKCKRTYSYSSQKRGGHGKTVCNSCVANKRRVARKEKAIKYKGGACIICGYNRCLRSLVFHHRDERQKKFEANSHEFCRSWEVMKEELDKCDLVCANCHGEIHDGLI